MQLPPLTTTDHVTIDFESFYDRKGKVTIKDLGVYRYVRTAYVYLVAIYDGDQLYVGDPRDFDWSSIAGRHWVSHNRSFDYEVHRALVEAGEIEDEHPSFWDCSADLATWCRSMRNLKAATLNLLKREIKKDVRSLMNGLMPSQMKELVMAENGKLYPLSGFDPAYQALCREVDPEDGFDHTFFGDVHRYGGGDAKDSWELWARYANTWPEDERRISRLSGQQGSTGILMDAPGLTRDVEMLNLACAYAKEQLPWAKDLPTDEGVMSIPALKNALIEVFGVQPPETTSEDSEACRAWEAKYPDIHVVRFMRDFRKANILRRRAEHILSRLMPNGRLPFAWTYGGAHTLRWAGGSDAKKGGTGESGFNVQNQAKEPMFIHPKTGAVIDSPDMPRWKDAQEDYFKMLKKINGYRVDLRARCIVPRGKKWICLDAEQIEARITLWAAGEDEALAKVKGGMSIYEVHARKAMGWTGGNLKKEDPNQQFMAKNRVLALGFGCGHVKFHDRCRELGFPITMREAKLQVDGFRRNERRIKALWYQLNNEIQAVAQRNRRRMNGTLVDEYTEAGVLENYEYQLPSGRWLIYFEPIFQTSKKTPEARQAEKEMANLKGAKKKWSGNNVMCRTEMGGRVKFFYGGKLLENIAQAIARDVLCDIMLKLDDQGIPMLFSVHDEEDLEADLDVTCNEIKRIAEENPPAWAVGLPISVEVKEGDHYFK